MDRSSGHTYIYYNARNSNVNGQLCSNECISYKKKFKHFNPFSCQFNLAVLKTKWQLLLTNTNHVTWNYNRINLLRNKDNVDNCRYDTDNVHDDEKSQSNFPRGLQYIIHT